MFPTEEYFADVENGNAFRPEAQQLLADEGFDGWFMSNALRALFETIALVYSPHREKEIRLMELQIVLNKCVWPGQLEALSSTKRDRNQVTQGSMESCPTSGTSASKQRSANTPRFGKTRSDASAKSFSQSSTTKSKASKEAASDPEQMQMTLQNSAPSDAPTGAGSSNDGCPGPATAPTVYGSSTAPPHMSNPNSVVPIAAEPETGADFEEVLPPLQAAPKSGASSWACLICAPTSPRTQDLGCIQAVIPKDTSV